MKFRTCLLAVCMVVVPTLAMFSHHIPTGARRSVRDCVHGWFTTALGGAGTQSGAVVATPGGAVGPTADSVAAEIAAVPTSSGAAVPIEGVAGGPFADGAIVDPARVDPARDVIHASPAASSPTTNDDVIRRLSDLGAVQIDCVSLPGVAGRHLASCQVPLDPDGQLHRVFQSEGNGAAAATQRLLDDVTAWRRRLVVRAAAVPPPGQPVPSVGERTN